LPHASQTAIGRNALSRQFVKLGLLSPDQPLPDLCRSALNVMWANNGDTLSRQYAGTQALKVRHLQCSNPSFSIGIVFNVPLLFGKFVLARSSIKDSPISYGRYSIIQYFISSTKISYIISVSVDKIPSLYLCYFVLLLQCVCGLLSTG